MLSAMIPSVRKVWANPWARRPALLALAVGGVFAACYFIIDHLGKRASHRVQKEMAEEGETVDFRQLLTPTIPDAENFCAVGPLRNLAASEDDASSEGEEGRVNRARIESLLEGGYPLMSSFFRREAQEDVPLDLDEFAEAMRKDKEFPMPAAVGDAASDVAAGFAIWDRYFDQLIPGLARPRAQWTPALRDRPLPRPLAGFRMTHLRLSLNLMQRLRVRASAAAQAGDVRRAIDCILCIARLTDASRHEHLPFNDILGGGGHVSMAKALRELCRVQRGTPAEWEQLEGLFGRIDTRRSGLHDVRVELAVDVDRLAFLRDTPFAEIARASGRSAEIPLGIQLLRLAPPGLYDAAAAEVARIQLRFQIRPLRNGDLPSLLRSHRALIEERAADARQPWRIPRTLAQKVLPSMDVLPKVVYQETLMNQAVIACALERARLAQGAYPPTLEGLTRADGSALPIDGLTGQPMHYRLTEDGRYMVWSVGPDGHDDHGLRGSTAKHSISDPSYEGDWVWSYVPAR
jgi:hypothetical protein